MELKNLFNILKHCKPNRGKYYIKWNIKFDVDYQYYAFSLLPTAVICPWTHRDTGESIIDVWWLNMHVTVGEWLRKE